MHPFVIYVVDILQVPASHLCTNIYKHQYKFFNTFCLCSQFQLVESIHRPIALKSSLCGGILESMCEMDCTPSVKGVLSPFSAFAFLQVIPTILSYCLPDWIAEC